MKRIFFILLSGFLLSSCAFADEKANPCIKKKSPNDVTIKCTANEEITYDNFDNCEPEEVNNVKLKTYSASLSYAVPDKLVENVNTALEKIPRVTVNVDSPSVTISGSKTECCPRNGKYKEELNGTGKLDLNVSGEIFGASVETIVAFGDTELKVTVNATVGVSLNTEVRGDLGWRKECSGATCPFAIFDIKPTIEVAGTALVMACVKVIGNDYCLGLGARISGGVTVRGTVSYNKTYCEEGLSGRVGYVGTIIKAEFYYGSYVFPYILWQDGDV